MTDKNNQEEALEEFLCRELAGVDLEGIRFEPSAAVSSGDSPESDSAILTWRDLEDLLSWRGFLTDSDDSTGPGLLGVIPPQEGEA
ncbi:MAG TPA: hypothetical protein VKG21_18375 [Casimicrobiaceae bacterium]|nr:hypothetical protein [Casimicrobiaceae bacterium]